MSSLNNLYCLILAGGKGRRLWPLSRVETPKQFVDIFGTGRTQLQQTWDRFRRFLPASHILVSTNADYRDKVAEQLPELEASNILAEPIWRNTAPSIAWGAHRICTYNHEATIIVAPSDQHVTDAEAFEGDVTTAAAFAATHDTLLVMGVKPTRPEPGYGYIQMDDMLEPDIYRTRSFTEKPERHFAQVFIDSGEFFWNTGMVVVRAAYLLDILCGILPPVLRHLNAKDEMFTIGDENRYVNENFPRYPNVSFEHGILEQVSTAVVMRCHFGWADFGTWHGIYEATRRSPDENVVLDSDVIADKIHGNIIKVPKGHLAVINGLDNYIVVENDNILLICPREDSSALIRKYSAEVGARK